VETLVKMHALERVSVTRTRFTEMGEKKLKRAIDGIDVLIDREQRAPLATEANDFPSAHRKCK
jgi:hypothetical protein